LVLPFGFESSHRLNLLPFKINQPLLGWTLRQDRNTPRADTAKLSILCVA